MSNSDFFFRKKTLTLWCHIYQQWDACPKKSHSHIADNESILFNIEVAYCLTEPHTICLA